MKNQMRQLETFNLYDYQGVEAHLTAMAAKGWRLEKTGNQLWTYRRAEPGQIRYAVTYSHELSQFDPVPTEGQEILEDLCEAAGWEKVCDWHQMQIFSTEAADPVPLETDEALRLENIHRTMKKHVLPINWVMLALALFMTASAVNTCIRTPLRFFENNSRLFSGLLFGLMTLLLSVNIGSYWLWRKKSLQAVAEGGVCVKQGPGLRWFALGSLILVILLSTAYAALETLTNSAFYAVFFLAYTLLLLLLTRGVHGTKNFLKRRGVSKRKNMAATLAVDLLLAFVLTGGLVFCALHFHWGISGRGETYIYQRMEWDADPIDIPLTAEGLSGQTYDHTYRWVYNRGSFLLHIRDYHERVLEEATEDFCFLSYEIWEPKTRRLYDAVLEDFLQPKAREYASEVHQLQDPLPWGAESVYQVYRDGEPVNKWMLCWPERIVGLDSDRPLSAEQMALAGRVLKEA